MHSVISKKAKGNRFLKRDEPFDRYIQHNTAWRAGRAFVAARPFVAIKRNGQRTQKLYGSQTAKSSSKPRLRQSPVPRRVLIAGNRKNAYQLANEFYRHFPQCYTVVGLVTNELSFGEGSGLLDSPFALQDGLPKDLQNEVPVLGHISDVAELSQLHQIDEVLIADYFAPEFKTWGAQISSAQRFSTRTGLRPVLEDEVVDSSASLSQQKRGYQMLKHLLDIVFSFMGLLLMAPLLVVLGLLNKAMAPGPVLFTQERVGQNGRRFLIYKLRTMRLDAEKESGPVLAQHHDPRCTPLGAFLRATKIDELPQLYNVLRGDMSLVGPRPERPVFVEMYESYIPRYAERHQVRPGLTGLAQVNGDQLTHVNVKLHYDLAYVTNCGLGLDLLLLARTPLVILKALFAKMQSPKTQPRLVQDLKQSPISA